jgi:hypothetical protein
MFGFSCALSCSTIAAGTDMENVVDARLMAVWIVVLPVNT